MFNLKSQLPCSERSEKQTIVRLELQHHKLLFEISNRLIRQSHAIFVAYLQIDHDGCFILDYRPQNRRCFEHIMQRFQIHVIRVIIAEAFYLRGVFLLEESLLQCCASVTFVAIFIQVSRLYRRFEQNRLWR